MERLDNGLSQVRSTQGLVDWWQETANAHVSHDFAVVGRIGNALDDHDAIEVLMQYGVLEGDRTHLLNHCVSLIRAWKIMRQVSVFDLGPCACVGTEEHPASRTLSRSFLIHGFEGPADGLTFLILSAECWADEVKARDFVTHLVKPLAMRAKHLPGMKAHIFSDTRSGSMSLASQPTPREEEIARLLFTGHSNKEIAKILAISANTVRNHISRLSEKLGARNRTQIAMLLSNRGVLASSSTKNLHNPS